MTDQPKPTTSTVLKNYNFRLLWIGQGTSLLGDQFFMIALPWLVIRLTGNALALGTVIAMIGVPRAIFMLVGGATTDRFTPRTIMLISDVLRLLLTTMLALMIITGTLQLWMLYLLALMFGTISGFFQPASGSMIPLLLNPDELVIGNSIYQGTSYLTSFLGPVLAGALIALFAHASLGGSNSELIGIAVTVAFDAFTFLVSIVTLLLMRWHAVPVRPKSAETGILGSIKEGISFVWTRDLLRTVFILMLVVNFIFAGPVVVGIPVLVNTRLTGGAASYGLIMGSFGFGNLLGIILAPRILGLLNKRLGAFMVAVIASFGIALLLMGIVTSTAVCILIFLVVGIGNGALAITLMTFLQRQTPKELLGRVMSLVMLAGVGLVPVSQALAGALMDVSLEGVFLGAGVLMLLAAFWLALQPVIPTFHEAFAQE